MAAYSHERAAKETIHISWIYNINRMKQAIIYLETMKDSNLHLTTIRTVSSSCRCASIYTNRLSLILLWMSNSHFIWIFRAFPAHQTATFSPVLASTILHSDVVRLPTWCRLAGFFVLRASFHQSHGAHCAIRLLIFPRHFLTDVSKNYFSGPFRTSPGARLSLP